jgi:hypothetical protein
VRWEDAFDIKASKNVRGENVYDIYRKGTNEMLWADIPVAEVDEFLKGMIGIVDKVAAEEFDNLFGVSGDAETPPEQVTAAKELPSEKASTSEA